MTETKILFQIFDDEQTVLQKLSKFKCVDDYRVVDTYYYDPLRANLKPDAQGRLTRYLRIREQDGVNYISYKADNFDGNTWSYSDDAITSIEDVHVLYGIFHVLGLRELVVIDNMRRIYSASDYTIKFDTVKNLGLFLRVEYDAPNELDIIQIKKQIQFFLETTGLNLSPELNASKAELMLRNINK